MPERLIISSKTIALDTTWSKGLVKCEDIPGTLNTLNSCIIRKGSKQFIREYTILYDENQELEKLYIYRSMGPVISTKQELLTDTLLLNMLKLSIKNNIKVDKVKNVVIENGTLFKIVDYWNKEKLIFVAVDSNTFVAGRTLIYGLKR